MPLWTGLHACHRRRRGRASHLTGSGGRPADLGTGDLHDKIIGRYSNLREPHGHKVDHPNWLAMGEQAATNRITRSALNLEIQLGGASGGKCNGISPRYHFGRTPSREVARHCDRRAQLERHPHTRGR